MTDPNRSQRVGKKAPWPKGKTRNKPDPRWPELRKKVVDALETIDRNWQAGTNYRSAAYIGELCGVHRATVSRWLSKKAIPPASAIDLIEGWLKEIE